MKWKWTTFALGLLFLLVVTLAACIFKGRMAGVMPYPVTSETLEHISVPEGFRFEVYAGDVPGARSMALSDSGTLYVGTRDQGKVYAVVDENNDFRADRTLVIAEDLRMPNGVAVQGGDLYVAEIGRILKFPDLEGSLDDPPKPIVVSNAFPTDEHHGWKFIAFGPDGMLYVPVGAPCNICQPEDPIYATITRLSPNGGDPEIFARGVRNSVGFDWHPESDVLWFTDNGRDGMGDNIPPDELNRAPEPGLHFGFPFCHGTDIPDPELGRDVDCSRFVKPALELGPHVAALGMRFYTGTMFPDRYRGGIFIAEHGSWDRSEPMGYRVIFVPMKDDRPQAMEIFAEGWLPDNVAWGRPVDVQPMQDGSLLVSDDKAGKIYRIDY